MSSDSSPESESSIQELLDRVELRDGWEIRCQKEGHLEIDYLPARLSRLNRCHQNPGIDITDVGQIWWVGSTDSIGKGFEPENDDTRPGLKTVDCADFEDAVALVEHGMKRVEIAVGEELREAHERPLLSDGGVETGQPISHGSRLGPHRVPRIECGNCGHEHHIDCATTEYQGRCSECRGFLRRPTEEELQKFYDFLEWNSLHLDRDADFGGEAVAE